MSDEAAYALFPVMVEKIRSWELSRRARDVAEELATLSFGHGLYEVEVRNVELCDLLGLQPSCVSKAVAELVSGGVLQTRGRQRGSVFRLLPNGEYIEPPRRVDVAKARALRAEIARRNRGRVLGDDPGGQGMLVKPLNESLAEDLAVGSMERAIEDMTPEEIAEMARLSFANAGRRRAESDAAEVTNQRREVANLASSEPPRLPIRQPQFSTAENSPGQRAPRAYVARGESNKDREIVSNRIESRGNSGAVAQTGNSPRFRDEDQNMLVELMDEWLMEEKDRKPDLNLSLSRATWLARIRDYRPWAFRAFTGVAEDKKAGRITTSALGAAFGAMRRLARQAGQSIRMFSF